MAGKRSATSELNHDNWDEDVEPEEAGKFSQADENILKGRVIKKAKRRGIQPADGNPGAFASFGGFKSTAPSGGSSFDFLSKPSNGTSTTDNGNTGALGGFVFGAPTNGGSSTTVPTTFSFGSNSTLTNNTDENKQNKIEDIQSDTIKTNGANKTSLFQFGSASNSTSPSIFGGVKVLPPFATKSGSTDNVFGAAGSTNKTENGHNLKNDTTPPEKIAQSNNLTPLNQLAAFKPSGGGKWTCSTCMVGNEAEVEKCLCCETPKPGSNASKKEPSPVKSLGSIAPGGGFKFGVTSTTSASSNSTNSGFKFGSSTPSIPETQGFKFGSGNIGITTTGSTAANTNTKDVTFGNTPSEKLQEKNKSPSEKSTVMSDHVSDEEVKRVAKNSKEFVSHLSELNKQFFEWIDQHIKKNPCILISPCIRDYEKHLAELTKEYAKKMDGKDNTAPTENIENKMSPPPNKSSEKMADSKGLLSGVFANTSPAGSGTFSFGSNQPFKFNEEKKTDTTSEKESTNTSKPGGFTFGSGSTQPSTFSFGGSTGVGSTFGSGSMFGQAAAAAMQAKQETNNADTEENDDQPPKVEIKQVVEDDAIHSVRCKLFFKKDKEFAEKGLGMLYLKKVDGSEDKDGSKTQLLVRADTNLGNILLNVMLNNQMNLTKRNNCVQFVCIPNPEIPGVATGSPVTMLVKVKNADLASILEDEMKKRIDIL